MNWRMWGGVVVCILIIGASFMHWAWYPDLEQYFTGWYSEKNYYGKPGKIMTIIAGSGMLLFLIAKAWSHRLNLVFAAFNMGYAIYSYILFTSSYDGFVPRPEAGIYLMLAGAIGYLAFAVMVFGTRQVEQPKED